MVVSAKKHSDGIGYLTRASTILGIEDREIFDKIIVHHINPMTLEQLEEGGDDLFDLENFICCSYRTHEAIHYGDISILPPTNFTERKPGDTKLW